MRGGSVVLGLLVLLSAPAGASATVLARVDEPGRIAAWGGVQVWADGGSLMVRSRGRIAHLPGGGGVSDADVGPGPDGRPRIVYADPARGRRVVIRRPDGTGRRVVPRSSGASLPTISGTQVAWEGTAGTIRTSRIDGSQRRRIDRPLAGTELDALADLDLSGTTLALAASYEEIDIEDAVGLVDIVTGRRTTVERVESAQNGRTLLGVSWARGELFYYQTCINVTGRCSYATRYDPRTRLFAALRSVNRLEGFAVDDDGAHAFVIPRTAADPVDWTATTVQRVSLRR